MSHCSRVVRRRAVWSLANPALGVASAAPDRILRGASTAVPRPLSAKGAAAGGTHQSLASSSSSSTPRGPPGRQSRGKIRRAAPAPIGRCMTSVNEAHFRDRAGSMPLRGVRPLHVKLGNAREGHYEPKLASPLR
jgi:hypothetical protein